MKKWFQNLGIAGKFFCHVIAIISWISLTISVNDNSGALFVILWISLIILEFLLIIWSIESLLINKTNQLDNPNGNYKTSHITSSFSYLDYDTTIYSNKTVSIDWNNDYIIDEFKTSPNGKYSIVCACDKKDNMRLFVFTNTKLIYSHSFKNVDVPALENIYIFDDASAIVANYDLFVYINNEGEILNRKKIEVYEKHGIHNNTFWCLGENDNRDNIIILINTISQNVITKKLPNIEEFEKYNQFILVFGETDKYDIKIFIINLETSEIIVKKITYEKLKLLDNFEIEDATLFFNNNGIIFFYPNSRNVTAYDFSGNSIFPSPADIESAKQKLFLKQKKHLAYEIERITKKYHYWHDRLNSIKFNIFDTEKIEEAKQKKEYYKNKLKSLGVNVKDD